MMFVICCLIGFFLGYTSKVGMETLIQKHIKNDTLALILMVCAFFLSTFVVFVIAGSLGLAYPVIATLT